ncbi:hypothetical protein O3G_MSEX013219 [Manduca sexta]|uniref:Major facilitator superfamily (MFS) profile domain-containing protein n=1 Tax=Manduca sexta TaxID=7130 RepID=A0A921ZR90_MANSE|nr:hypothetical protein O3G_MSEX013219 [Manduca sexta]
MVLKLQIEDVNPAPSRLRSVTSQLLSCMSPNLLLLDLGMAISFATIALPDLLNAKDGLSLTETQASWFGVLLMYYLGTVVSWRTASLICLAAPLASMLLILFVPETPVWLLSQGREKDALKALCYLRGWTTPEHVQNEYTQLVVYTKNLKRCVICKTDDLKILDCEHLKINRIQRFILRFRYVFLAKETLRPLTLVMLYFMFYVMSGLTPIRPNMVNVCRAFGMADDGKNIVLTVGIITFITSIVVIGIIKMAGKRKLILTAMLGTAISCTALSVYAKLNLDDSVFSYNSDTFPTNTSYIPLTLFYLLTVFTGLNIPWVLLGEVFPFRSRASAQGFAAAWNYVVTFLGSKTYIDLEKSVRLWGTFAVYAGFGFVGTIYLYFFMPETEGKHLHEIENYYSGKLRIFADDPFINFFKRFKRK